MKTIWRRIRRNVIHGKETTKVDLKRELHLSTKPEKAEFAKDVMAIANTPGGLGYLVYGVLDKDERSTDRPDEYIVGIDDAESPDSVLIKMVDALDYYCEPPPEIDYEIVVEPETRRRLGIVIVATSVQRPHGFARDGSSFSKNSMPIRRGSRTFPQASPVEVRQMTNPIAERLSVIVVSLNGHPLTDYQRLQVQEKYDIEEEIEIPVHFDASPIQQQAQKIMSKADLTLEEWSSGKVLLIPPGLAPPALALIAYIHGLTGNFPKIGWIEKGAVDGLYQLREIIDLQVSRDEARSDRLHFGG